MTFTVLLTHPDQRFRERLAAQLRRVAHPAEVEALGESRYRFTVNAERAAEVRQALANDIVIWGAEVTEADSYDAIVLRGI